MLKVDAMDSGVSKNKVIQNYLMKMSCGRIEIQYYDSAYEKLGMNEVLYMVQRDKEKVISKTLIVE